MESILTMVNKSGHFDPLSLRRRAVADPSLGHYRIFKNATESTVVEAKTAAEAFKLSGYDVAYRINRESTMLHEILTRAELEGDAGFVSTNILLPEGSIIDGIFVHAPKETGAPVLPQEELESVRSRFESMTLAGLGKKMEAPSPAPEILSATPVETAPEEPILAAPEPWIEEPEPEMLDEMPVEAMHAPAATDEVQAGHELSADEVRKLLGE